MLTVAGAKDVALIETVFVVAAAAGPASSRPTTSETGMRSVRRMDPSIPGAKPPNRLPLRFYRILSRL